MKQPSSTRRKQTAKAVILFFLGISVLCSCQRGIDITKIEAMPEGAAKDSAMLYYYQGVRPGDFVIVKKSTKDELNEINDSAIPIYLTTSAEVKRDQDLNVTNKVCQIFRGDTLQIVGGYDKSLSREKFMKKTDYSHAVIVKAIKNGKTVGEGWCDAGMFNPLQHNWAIVFYQPQDVLALLFIFGGAFFLVFLLWKLIYWLVVSKIRKNVCFYQRDKIYFKAIYLIVSALVGLFIFYVDYNEDLVSSLKFNPDFFAHFSEYPFMLKLLPLMILLWIASTIGMLWEMIKKFKTWWLIIYFPGIWSIGFLIIALIFATSWLIYFILPTVVAFAIMALVKDSSFVKAMDNSSGKSSKPVLGYNAQGQPVREGDGGAIAHRTWDEYANSK